MLTLLKFMRSGIKMCIKSTNRQKQDFTTDTEKETEFR